MFCRVRKPSPAFRNLLGEHDESPSRDSNPVCRRLRPLPSPSPTPGSTHKASLSTGCVRCAGHAGSSSLSTRQGALGSRRRALGACPRAAGAGCREPRGVQRRKFIIFEFGRSDVGNGFQRAESTVSAGLARPGAPWGNPLLCLTRFSRPAPLLGSRPHPSAGPPAASVLRPPSPSLPCPHWLLRPLMLTQDHLDNGPVSGPSVTCAKAHRHGGRHRSQRLACAHKGRVCCSACWRGGGHHFHALWLVSSGFLQGLTEC